MKKTLLKVLILVLCAAFPTLLFSQMRIKNNMELRLKSQSQILVTGDVEMQASSMVTIFGDFSISGHLSNYGNANQFVLKSDVSNTGSLIVIGNITGDYTIERYLSSSSWHFLSASVEQLSTSTFYYDGNPWTWASYYDEPTGSWGYLAGQNDPMPLGNGYKFWLGEATKSSVLAEMKGELISNDLAVNITTDHSSWNLIGNPFSASINWDHPDWGSNSNGSVYVWDSTYNSGDYRVWNGTAGDLTDGNIPISQGFFIYASSAGSFNIPAAARTHQGDNFYKSDEKIANSYIKLQLQYQNFGNTLFIGFPEHGSPGFDDQGDAYKLYSNSDHSQIYAMENGEKLCINANVPLQNESRIVPIYIDQWEEASYTLTLSNLENLPHTEIILEDRSKELLHDFSLQPFYTFQAQINDPHERFFLHFKKEANQISELNDKSQLLSVYSNMSTIFIKSKEESKYESGSVFIYNQLGQLSYEGHVKEGALFQINPHLPSGNYIIKVIKKSSQISAKVILLN